MNTWGQKLKLAIFGESHGRAIGITVDGLPAGEIIDKTEIQAQMAKRAPGRHEYSTARKENDEVEILSGLLNDKTTGAPICGLIFNNDTRSSDYDPSILRPGHADWTARQKYGHHADLRGGGHFSGRLTAPLVFAGSLAKQILARRNVNIFGRIASLGAIVDEDFTLLSDWQNVAEKKFPVSSEKVEEIMKQRIKAVKAQGDSVGGTVEAIAFGVPSALGEPFFNSVESTLASLIFSIPAVKGLEFGRGFQFAHMLGSTANDSLTTEKGQITGATNNNGGILGGLTSGLPIIVRAAFKPTPSIAKTQQTVKWPTGEAIEMQVKGRHDPCIVPRAVVLMESALALGILDLMLINNSTLTNQPLMKAFS
ncbi:MAG: chorismate synthase [Candidatus Adiutrix sp.]